MNRQSPLTYRGALQSFNRYDSDMVEKIDRAVGSAVLGVGAVAAAFAVTGNPAPAILISIWGWIDQKNEATRLLKGLVSKLSRRINNQIGYSRRELVSAAHTAIVVDAYFRALHDHLGASRYMVLKISEGEKALLTEHKILNPDHVTRHLYSESVPAPSAAVGFEENVREVGKWMAGLAERTYQFLSGLEAWRNQASGYEAQILNRSIDNYRANYTDLARDVPEFHLWTAFGEHAATRAAIHETNKELLRALASQGEALAQLENLLLVRKPKVDVSGRDFRNILARANRVPLADGIVPAGVEHSIDGLRFPTVSEIYVNPRFKYCVASTDTRIADETWWRAQPSYDNIGAFFAAHLAAPGATASTLLILGHPGAGKSLLTKVLAARLPETEYTAIRVSLRNVRADAPIYEQIQQALDVSTSGRVRWGDLAGQGRDTVRVVLMDGLDELIQASPGSQHSFFRSVVEFQRAEASQDLPVVIIVTSRTVVADQVEVPIGTTVMKLEEFDEAQVGQWLTTWRAVNAAAVESGIIGVLDVEVALGLRELSTQPLLLLMLALYSADLHSPPLTSGLSTAALYRQLLRSFASREVMKLSPNLNDDRTRAAVEEHLWRLTVAAFAMFNRGKQFLADFQLGGDLTALGDSDGATAERPAESGQDVVGKFFFIHSAEAMIAGRDTVSRCYEFLHATFGEYLVADEILSLLIDLTKSSAPSKRTREPDDGLLFALISCQPLTSRRSILQLASQLARELTSEDRESVLTTLCSLVASCKRRHDSDRYMSYRPVPVDRVRAIAVYALNLVAIAASLNDRGGVAIARMCSNADAHAEWQSLVRLWRSCLNEGAVRAILATLEFDEGFVRTIDESRVLRGTEFLEVGLARLMGDYHLESKARFGTALVDSAAYYFKGEDWEASVLSSLSGVLSFGANGEALTPDPPESATSAAVRRVGQAICQALKTRCRHMTEEAIRDMIRWLLDEPRCEPDPYAFASAVIFRPSLLDEFPRLADPKLYDGGGWGVWLLLRSGGRRTAVLGEGVRRRIPAFPTEGDITVDQTTVMLRQILKNYRDDKVVYSDTGTRINTILGTRGHIDK